jgi:hypothetical protein
VSCASSSTRCASHRRVAEFELVHPPCRIFGSCKSVIPKREPTCRILQVGSNSLLGIISDLQDSASRFPFRNYRLAGSKNPTGRVYEFKLCNAPMRGAFGRAAGARHTCVLLLQPRAHLGRIEQSSRQLQTNWQLCKRNLACAHALFSFVAGRAVRCNGCNGEAERSRRAHSSFGRAHSSKCSQQFHKCGYGQIHKFG